MEAILIGYDMYKYIDGSHPPPSQTTTNTTTPNPKFQTWVRQDKLIFGALVGSITSPLIPLITQSKTYRELWDTTLANMYARPSRGYIKQIKDQIRQATKGTKTIFEYMQFILGKLMDQEDIIETILDGLDDDYRPIIDAINGRDEIISFDELHEKLINREVSLRQNQPSLSPNPITVNPTYSNNSGRSGNRSNRAPGLPHQPHRSNLCQHHQPVDRLSLYVDRHGLNLELLSRSKRKSFTT